MGPDFLNATKSQRGDPDASERTVITSEGPGSDPEGSRYGITIGLKLSQ